MSESNRRETVTGSGWRTWIDLAAVVGLAALTVVLAVLPETEGSPIRFVVGVAFVSFLPGYAFVATLFPDTGSPRSGRNGRFGTDRLRRHDVDLVERCALALALSITITPLVGVVLGLTPWGMSPATLFVSIGIVTVVLTTAAAIRRRRLPAEERFSVPVGPVSTASAPSSTRRGVLSVALGVAVMAAVSSVVYAIATPQEGERYTELQLLTEGDDGFVAADYPREFTAGEGRSLVVGIENHERETVTYTVVVLLEALDEDETVETEELDRFSTELDHGERVRGEHTVTPELVGEDLRLSYLLYPDEPPAEPTRENAYEHVHIWIDVSEA